MATKNQIGTATGAANTLLQGAGVGSAPTFQASPQVSGSITAGTGITSTTGDIDATAGNLTAGGYLETAGDITSTAGEVIAYGHHKIYNEEAAAAAHALISYKNRSGGAITSGDTLAQFDGYGHDGTGYVRSGSIKIVNTGTIDTNRIGSNITFATHPDSAAALSTRMTIESTGTVSINAPDAGNALEVAGDVDVTTDVITRTLFADGDEGTGKASTNALTNVVNSTLSTGVMTINSTTANPGTNTGFIKMYVGTTAVWVPYFDDIAP
jgi:hypothetical protein